MFLVSVSERLSSIKLKAPFNIILTVCSSVTQVLIYYISTRFLYYFCLCKSFKELFLYCHRFLESGCKGTAFFRTTKTFRGKISVFKWYFYTSWRMSTTKNVYTLLLIRAKTTLFSVRQSLAHYLILTTPSYFPPIT